MKLNITNDLYLLVSAIRTTANFKKIAVKIDFAFNNFRTYIC